VLSFRRARREGQRHRTHAGKQQKLNLPLARHLRAIHEDGEGRLGALDKSGIAELTFKGRGPRKKK